MATLPALAGEPAPALVAATCTACHGPGGKSPGTMPAIDPLAADAIRTALLDFKRGARPGTIMPRIARGLTEGEIAGAAAYLARAGR